MAKANVTLIRALRETAARLRAGAPYQWGHFGACNCGHLAQTLTHRTQAELHRLAHLQRAKDWEDQANDFCPTSGLPLDQVICDMLEAGLTTSEIGDLENLADPAVLGRLPPERRELTRYNRDDAVLYMEAWAGLLEEQLFAERAAGAQRTEAPRTERKTSAA